MLKQTREALVMQPGAACSQLLPWVSRFFSQGRKKKVVSKMLFLNKAWQGIQDKVQCCT